MLRSSPAGVRYGAIAMLCYVMPYHASLLSALDVFNACVFSGCDVSGGRRADAVLRLDLICSHL